MADKKKKSKENKARSFLEKLFSSAGGRFLPGAQSNQTIEATNRKIQEAIGKKARKKK